MRSTRTVLTAVTLTFAFALTGQASGAEIAQEVRSGASRAEACLAATRAAETGKFGFLQSQGQISSVEKKCDCDQNNKGVWSCIAYIAYTTKK